jgi:hypothetical protein
VKLIREGLIEVYKAPYPLLTPSSIKNVFIGSSGKPADLESIMNEFLIEYIDHKFYLPGEFPGVRRYLSPDSPYSITRPPLAFAGFMWDKFKIFVVTFLVGGIGYPIVNPFLDFYKEMFFQAKDKIIGMSQERRDRQAEYNRLKQLIAQGQSKEFKSMDSKAERLQKWRDLEKQLAESYKNIRDLSAKINKSPPSLQMQADRDAFSAALVGSPKDSSPLSLAIRARALAHLKGVDLIDGKPLDPNSAAGRQLEEILERLADTPEAFQAFVSEYLDMQSLQIPVSF